MAGTSAGSDVFVTAAVLAITLITLLVLRHYVPIRTTPAYLLVPVFLALFLPSSIILLVPIDLASSAGEEPGYVRGIWLPDGALLVMWRITYWLTFTLTWVVLPLLGEYADAGYREPKRRILYSLRSNARYQLTILACAVAGLIYFFLQSGVRVTSLKALVMALAYAWGLILAIYLMGHGLVAIPRRLYRSASLSGRLRRLETSAPSVYDRMTGATEELEQLENQVLRLRQGKNGTARDLQEWIEELADTSDLQESRTAQTPTARVSQVTIPAVITERYLADLARKLKRARHKRVRFVEEWDRLLRDAADIQTVLNAASSRRLDFGRPSPTKSWFDMLPSLTPYTRYLLHAYILPGITVLLSVFFGAASACIVWSEVFKSTIPKISVVGLSIVHHPNSHAGKIDFKGQVIAACWLLYMCAAALSSLREVKVWGNRALVRRHTYAESACWYACQVAKLTVPLSYNFITFVERDIFENTTFYQFLGRLINLTPLGTNFSSFFPIFILVPVLATSFNLYGKVKIIAGFGVMEDEDVENPLSTGGWREGRALIDRELHTGNGVSLSSRDHSPRPKDTDSGASTPIRRTTTNRANESSLPAPRRVPREERQRLLEQEIPQDEEGESGFFQDFAHRVRNTIDTVDKPAWMSNAKFKKPRWMGGGEGSTGENDRADFGIGRWFSGKPDDGHLRL